ncbi:SPASM domain-containing protein [Clostridium sp. D2Q-14]|uniref:radical SAM/SPASM domain-containing protein n=1 Tax=Anaeromonas gelatinilytica TaxID=2683194 RepID=UPI00193C7658|nr:radical SAM protein [Anaeromonas gelatinilytica]MBS4535685.1 SPASM domain-containing protein [Anaeromonas gelatinilytica]
MELEMNNLVYEYKGKKINVPLFQPWEVYEGLTNIQPNFLEEVRKKREFSSYITLHITNECNLNCTYCFEKDKGNFTISEDKIIELYSFLLKNNKSDNLEIRLFGGEPLLKFNIIKRIINTFKDLNNHSSKNFNISYNIFTNATIINNEIIDFLKENDIQVFTSIDCNKQIHNRNRIDINGNGTYDKVIKNAKLLNKNLSQRVVVRSILDTSEEEWNLVEYCCSLFDQGLLMYSIEFPWTTCDSLYALSNEKLNIVKRKISEYCDEYINRIKRKDFSLIGLHPFVKYISKAINNDTTLCMYSCGAGYSGLAVTAEGEIFPCHAFTNYEKFKLGNTKRGIINKELLEVFENYGADNIKKCNTCSVKYLCMNRCPFDSFIYNGDVFSINDFRCEIQKEIIKASFYLLNEINKLPLQKRVIKMITKKLFYNVDKHT